MTEMHPPIEPFASGLLAVSGGAEIYWEASGNPRGKPALYLHGGPGSGLGSGRYRWQFDPETYLLLGLDQRGCGRSRPLACDALDALQFNTTGRLIEDIEALRRHMGIERWLVSGRSWGATLALAYAEAHPDAVSELVLVAVTTTSRDEVMWITEGMRAIFPEAWQRLERQSGRLQGERLIDAYARRLAAGSVEERLAAARAWIEWEETHVSLDPNWTANARGTDDRADLNFATLVTHYWANDGFLRNGNEILGRTEAIAHIPAILIHGRRDISGPAITAWKLHQQLPASRLDIVEDDGHGGPQSMQRMRAALHLFGQA